MKTVGIVVLNYKNWQDTLECIEHIFRNEYDNYQLIIVDNYSQNNSLAHIRMWLQQRNIAVLELLDSEIETVDENNEVILIQSSANKGYAAGNNLGIALALKLESDYVLILNNDVLVEKDSLVRLVDFMDNNPHVGIAGPKIVREDGALDRNCARRRPEVLDYFFRMGIGRILFPQNRWVKSHYYIDEYDFSFPKEIDVVSGACMLVRRNVFDEIGLLDENTFLYQEEFILHEKLRDAKISTVVVPESQVVHKHGKSTAGEEKALLMKALYASLYYYLTSCRNYHKCFAHLIVANVILKHRINVLISRMSAKKKHVPYFSPEESKGQISCEKFV